MSIEEDGVYMLRKFKDKLKKEPQYKSLSIHLMSKSLSLFLPRTENLLFKEKEKAEDLKKENIPDKKFLTNKYLLSISFGIELSLDGFS